MECMPFPSQYREAVLGSRKNSTIRIGAERGKYEAGKVYAATSYAGKPWGVRIRILEVIPATLGKLSDFGIPKRSIEATRKKEKISLDEPVELIRFEVLVLSCQH